ncbi:hypothetical protein [Novosphingopyxis sp. YJ-S2-01]|uniref:hypothetical protein n=1 Tax=Novosphingopyxis sp. YJ-S2-01 TaxID=2794021 RepID=UPI0018DCF910|nr:hypothetical protein [Novosphingopyxis sp. YJ-S2-01]MBH9538446.1 hypothetical protein [Novosphingopyxis sp. YJ-S2-01]
MPKSEAEMALDDFFVEREGEGAMDEIRQVDLIDAGILDSLDLVTMSVFLENRLGQKVDLGDPATFEAFRRYQTLLDLLNSTAAGSAPIGPDNS